MRDDLSQNPPRAPKIQKNANHFPGVSTVRRVGNKVG